MFPNFAPILRRLDRPIYVVWAAVHTLISARAFYGYMLKQTGGEWSAPLDDVFIHFDYARATALGHPFEWTVGNGYSSGNTSLTYPFVLALGWLIGFTGRSLMKWAAIVACVSVFGTLLAARRLFIEPHSHAPDDWGRLSSYLLPPAFLGIGALTWSLWSGMEVSFFLATWAIALVAWLGMEERIREGKKPGGWLLGLAGGLLVTTRPEAALTIAVFGVAAALRSRSGRIGILLRVALPGVVLLALQAAANKAFTGELSANGAIVKLALNNPFMTGEEKYADWLFNVRYAALRNLDYHFAHIEGDRMSALVEMLGPKAPAPLVYLARTAWWAGVVPLILAALPLCFARTRRIAVVLWAQIVGWILLVAFNGQVRWQNERYVMPAVAWLLVLAVLGVSVSFRKRHAVQRPSLRPSIPLAVVAATVVAPVLFAADLRIGGGILVFVVPPWFQALALFTVLLPTAALVGLAFARFGLPPRQLVTEWLSHRSHGRLRPSIPMAVVVGGLVVQTIGVLTRPAGETPSFRVSWLLAFACAGVAAFVLRFRAVRVVLVTALVLFAIDHQSPKMRDQKWFFGRASRNIRDQHLTLGKYLAETKPRRVLVGDAGAILYESDRPGLDIIGLGGYHELPFARAGVHGLPATLELLERMPKGDRPDVLAIFPTWWGVLPVWFADDVLRRFPVEGNVICGGYEQNVYRANWSLLNTGDAMRWEPPADPEKPWAGRTKEKARIEVDVGDLVSEKEHGYRFDQPQNGWTDMRILPDPADSQKDMFDGGRRIAIGKKEGFAANDLVLGRPFHLVVRVAQESTTNVRVRIDGQDAGTLALGRTNGWEEKGFLVPERFVAKANVRVELTNEGPGDFVDYHLWITQ